MSMTTGSVSQQYLSMYVGLPVTNACILVAISKCVSATLGCGGNSVQINRGNLLYTFGKQYTSKQTDQIYNSTASPNDSLSIGTSY